MYEFLHGVLSIIGTIMVAVVAVAVTVLIFGALKLYLNWVQSNMDYKYESFFDKLGNIIKGMRDRKDQK